MWVLLIFLCQFTWHGHGHGLGGGSVWGGGRCYFVDNDQISACRTVPGRIWEGQHQKLFDQSPKVPGRVVGYYLLLFCACGVGVGVCVGGGGCGVGVGCRYGVGWVWMWVCVWGYVCVYVLL